jgi:TolA-binding protein
MERSSGQLSLCARYLFAWVVFALILSSTPAVAQNASSPETQQMTAIESKLNDLSQALTQTQKKLEESREEIQALHSQLDALRAEKTTDAVQTLNQDVGAMREQQDAMQAEIKQHDQTKVETFSKYPLRLSGLILFNAFSNAGVVDDTQVPTVALTRVPGASHGSSGANLRQTLLALDANGPRMAGARSSANVSVDFFGGATTNSYGYTSTEGVVRMRQSWVSLDWYRTTAQAGYTVPLISPLSPTSYATVAQPGMAGSGNLWTWSPQLRVEQRIPFTEQRRIALEGGLIDPPASSYYTSTQLDSPVEASRHPGYEGRVSYAADGSHNGVPRPFVLGIGGYSAHQLYTNTPQIHAWALTGDWQIPIYKWFSLSGEAYRGRALGGLGGGTYKDIFTATDSTTGRSRTTGVATVGGWTQLKFGLSSTLQANAAFGLDDAFATNFDGFNLPSTSPTARNSSVVGNFIYRPKSYLIFSPEYRHIRTWPYEGSAFVANIFTLTAGYEF